MSNSNYPIQLDTDAELPRVEDNISEIGGECINALRSAVFAIEKALGRKPQGTATDLTARLGVSLDNNGNIKASALAASGLVTLPITNAQIGSAAGIEETKLDLDYGTALLKSWIDSLRVRVDALEAAVALDIAHLTQHVAHPAIWGRHTTGDVDAYDVFTGMTAQGALTDLDTRLNTHITDPVDAHDGSAISLDASHFSSITATDVQSGAEQLESLQLVEIIRHRDRQHGNGILGTQDACVAGTRHGVVIIPASTTSSATIGDTGITFASTPDAAAFQSIAKNDRIDFTIGGKTYTFIIERTESTNRVDIFGSLPVSGVGMATVYRSTEETVEPSAAMVCLRRDALGSISYDPFTPGTKPSTLQIIHPASPYILSSGFCGSDISPTVRHIRLIYPGGNTYDMDAYAAMSAFWPSPRSTWTVDNMAKVLNAYLLSPGKASLTRHPLVAFAYKGELGFAYDLPDIDGYLTIGITDTYDATTTLGFVAGTTAYAMVPRNLYIDGYEVPSIRLLFDAYGQVTGSSEITFPSANPLVAGVQAGHLAKLSVIARGTYVIDDVTASAIKFDSANEYDFTSFIGGWARVRVYADAFSLAASPTEHILYETFLDGYNDGYGSEAGFKASARATYTDTGGFVSLMNILDLTAISRTFGSASRRLFYNSTKRTMELGVQEPGPSISNPGSPVVMPSDARGVRFTLYDTNGVDYLEFEVAGTLPSPGSDGYLDITSHPCISEERFLQLATVLHNGKRFIHLKDTRQFGTVGRQDVRDDFTRDYVSYPRSLIRGNGVIYGFVGTGTGTGTLTVTGGQALVNGQLKSVGKLTFAISADGGATYNLFMDSNGVLRLLQNDFFSSNILATPSAAELLASKTETMLAQVVTNGSNIITNILDMRRFVNDIDSKLDIVVEQGDLSHGSFASLEAAVAYLDTLPTIPIARRIKIRGNVSLNTIVTLPPNSILEGDSHGYSASPLPSTITFASASATIWPSDGCVIRDLMFYRSGTLTNGFLRSHTPFKRVKVEHCRFEFASSTANNNAIVLDSSVESVLITGCWFKNTDTAILGTVGAGYSDFSDNFFNEFRKCAIRLDYVLDCKIRGNHLFTSSIVSATGTAGIQLGNSSGTVMWTSVSDNIIVYNGSGSVLTTGTPMIDIQSASSVQSLFIDNNVLMSFPTAGVGFSGAIACTPTVGSEVIVTNNLVYNFTFASGEGGFRMSNCSQSTVVGNRFIHCTRTMGITYCNYVLIANNIIQNGVGSILDGHFSLDFCVGFIIHGNTISADGIGWLADTGASASNGVICNNFFEYTGSARGFLLDSQADHVVISNNVFVAGVLTLYEALRGGDYNLITGNILKITTPASTNLISIGTGTVEVLNKGQAYTIWLPIHHAMFASQWVMGINSEQAYISATTTTTDNEATLDFSAFDVPAGARIDKVTVWYTNAGAVGDITFELYELEFPAASTSLSATVNALSGGPISIDITPTSTYYMPSGSKWVTLAIVGKNGTVILKIIWGMTVTFTL